MANIRLNQFQNIPTLQMVILDHAMSNSNNQVQMHGVIIPGSISFNNVAILLSGSGGVSEDLSISFGLYSLTGSTLSLANSASRATGLTLNQTMFSWLSLATSATQDITPGNWYFGFLSLTTLGSSFSVVVNRAFNGNANNPAGIFVRGYHSVSTSELPASIATSDMVKEFSSTNTNLVEFPYIIISA